MFEVHSLQHSLRLRKESETLARGYEASHGLPEFLGVGVLEHRTSKDDFVRAMWITGVHAICSLLQSVKDHGEVDRQCPGFLVMIKPMLKKFCRYF